MKSHLLSYWLLHSASRDDDVPAAAVNATLRFPHNGLSFHNSILPVAPRTGLNELSQ